jgi:type IV secretory pathway VirB2 component (pilin)
LTRRFDIGPILLALGALLLLVGLFLNWYGPYSAWNAFDFTDVALAALAVAGLVAAAGLLLPELEYFDRRALPWIVGAAFVLVAAELIDPPPGASGERLGTGAWLALAGTGVMVAGAVLTFSRVSFAVAVEGRDRRTRVAAVDHQGPPTETGTPVPRPSDSHLHPPGASES